MLPVERSSEEVLEFWFRDCRADPRRAEELNGMWFAGGEALDDEIRDRFESWVDAAANGELDSWQSSPRGRLALILLLDQFTRSIYRGTARAFSGDEHARAVARQLVERGLFDLTPPEQVFALLPFGHSEDLGDQEKALELLDRCVDSATAEWKPLLEQSREFARDHHNVVARFGRFPHRNAALGRSNTREEEHFLAQGAESWGQ